MATEEVLIHTEYNATTGEQIDRPFTEEETARYYAWRAEFETREAEREAQALALAEAKASALAKLEALGLTEEEAKAIAG
jgi:hypothetical protein